VTLDDVLAAAMVAALSKPEVAAAIHAAAPPDPWLDLEAAARHAGGVAVRVLADAIGRGELVAGAAGRKPVVRCSELDRWIESRGRRPRPVDEATTEAAGEAAASRAAERYRRAG
jgi:hypothetical protein